MFRKVLNLSVAACLICGFNVGAVASVNNASVNNAQAPVAAQALPWPTKWCPPFMPRQFCPK